MRPKTYTLAKAIQERKEILFNNGDSKSQHSVKEKEEAWEAVRLYMITNGFPNFEKKTWRDVRNHDWQYLRRSAAAKLELNQKSGNDSVQYSEVDKIVFDIMGNDKTFDECEYEKSYSEYINHATEDGGSHSSPNSSTIEQKVLSINTSNGAHSDHVESDGSMSSFPSVEPNNTQLFMKMMAPRLGEKQEAAANNVTVSISTNNSYETMTNGLLTTFSPATAAFSGEFINSLNSILERNTASPNVQNNKRKRLQTVEDDLQDAKLELLLMQVKREEALLQQDQARVLQEYAKARQEHAKAELLEYELAEKRKCLARS